MQEATALAGILFKDCKNFALMQNLYFLPKFTRQDPIF